MRMWKSMLFLAMALVFTSTAFALDRTDTGFVYPIGTKKFDTSGGYWLSRPPDYFKDRYHIGVDMMANSGSPVYAIADGYILAPHISSDSWGDGNCGLFVVHETINGQKFTALYGHLTVASTKASGEVKAGEKIGQVGNYKYGNHLHFGIFPGTVLPGTNSNRGWGMMNVSQWNLPNPTNGFVDPIAFIKNNYPLNPSKVALTACLGNLCWEPADKPCDNASRWYLCQDGPYLVAGMPLVYEVGAGYCGDAFRKAEAIANDKASREVPEGHWWQSWFRKIFGKVASAQEGVDVDKLITYRAIAPCGNDGSFLLLSGNGAIKSDAYGQGYYAYPNDAYVPGLPNLTGEEVKLTTSDNHERYKFNPPETVKMRTEFSNIGPGNPTCDIPVHWYLSEGYKEDPHSKWKRVAEDNIKPENLKSGDTHWEEAEFTPADEGLAPGVYNIVACIDHPKDDHNNGGNVPEEHESDNCTTEAVFEVRDPNSPTEVDIVVPVIYLKSVSDPIRVGDGIGARTILKNIGTEDCPVVTRCVYEIYGPATNYIWQAIADDGTDANQLMVGMEQVEEINSLVPAPSVPGIYWMRVRADYLNAVFESDETNNISSEISFEVFPAIVRSITITSPKSGDTWRTDKEYKIQWTSQNISGKVRIEYSINGGGSWSVIDSGATNDGSKKWQPPKDKIKKDTNCYIRITSCSYPGTSAISPKFKIDHKK